MTFGLLSQMYDNYRIRNSTDRVNGKEGYRAKDSLPKQMMSFPTRGAYIILEVALTIIALLALWDCYLVKGWNTWTLALILVLFCIPIIGDLTALFIIILWIVEVRANSQILANFNRA